MAETQSAPPKVEPAAAVPAPPVRNLPPPRGRHESETRKSRAIPILITLLVGCAIAVVAYFVRQPIGPPLDPPVQETKKPDPPPKPVETRVAATPEPVPPTQTPATVPAPTPAARETPREADPQQRPARLVTSVEIPVMSDPPGATVTLDGLAGTACTTPCALKASAGDHTISLNMAGFKTLLRTVKVTGSPVELPVLTLARASGLLMLQTNPTGATITIDDKRWSGVSPAQISLAPGKYRVIVEKGDLKSTPVEIEIKDGDLRHLTIPLNSP